MPNFHLILTDDEISEVLRSISTDLPDLDVEWSEGPEGSVVVTVKRRSAAMRSLLDSLPEPGGPLVSRGSFSEHGGDE